MLRHEDFRRVRRLTSRSGYVPYAKKTQPALDVIPCLPCLPAGRRQAGLHTIAGGSIALTIGTEHGRSAGGSIALTIGTEHGRSAENLLIVPPAKAGKLIN